jgi:hypothetical protein
VLSDEAPEIERDVNQDTLEELSHEDQSPATNVESPDHSGKHHHPTKAKSGEHVGDLDIRIKRAEEFTELRQEKRASSLLGQPSTPTRDHQDGRIYEERSTPTHDYQDGRVYEWRSIPTRDDEEVRIYERSIPICDYQDARTYEERVPGRSYLEEGCRYREEEPRPKSRKHDVSQPERRPDVREPEKERKSAKWPEMAAYGQPFNAALKAKVKAKTTREITKHKIREKEREIAKAEDAERGEIRVWFTSTNQVEAQNLREGLPRGEKKRRTRKTNGLQYLRARKNMLSAYALDRTGNL